MLMTLALVVLFASIAVFFSQEFISTFKKIMAIKGATLILPLALGSWLVCHFDYWILWLLFYLKGCLNQLLAELLSLLPARQWSLSFAMILLLTCISVVPVFIIDIITRKKTYRPYKYPYVTSTILWIVTAMLMMALSL